MKILNLYAGIGGNRKLWGNEHEITSVEFNEKIANQYHKLYPNDKIIVADACLLYTSPSPRDVEESRMPSSA